MSRKWQVFPLGTLCSIKNGKSNAEDAEATGEYAFFDRSKRIKRSTRYLYDCEALIIPGEGAEFLPRHFIGKFDLHQRAYALFAFSDSIDVRFLYYYLHYFKDYFTRVAVGATVKSLRLRHFEQLPVPVPAVGEQQRIVGILDEAFDGIATARANAERNLHSAQELFESQLQCMFARPGDGWVERLLSDVAREFGRGRSRHRPRNDPSLYGGDYPFIQTGDVRNATHAIASYSQTYSEVGLAQSKLWPAGTLCITIAANIAETGILGFDACFPDSVIGVVVNEEMSTSAFLQYLLRSFKARLQAQGKGSAQDNINLGTFERQRFPFPCLEVQKAIVAKLDSLREEVEGLGSIYRRKLAALDELKQSLLHQAFTGAL